MEPALAPAEVLKDGRVPPIPLVLQISYPLDMAALISHGPGPEPWARAVLTDREDLGALRESLSALPPRQGFGAFALRDRGSTHHGPRVTVYLSPDAAPAGPTTFGAWGPWEESGPPADDERLVLLGGDAHLWTGVVSRRAAP